MASMRAPQAHWKLWTASHCVASAFPPGFVSMSVPAPGETPAPAGEVTRLFPSSLQRDPESWLALAARPVPRPAATLEAELVQLALRPQFDLAAAWAALIPRLPSASQSPRSVPSSLQLGPNSHLAVAVPQPAATLESELVQLALRPQFDLAALWAASIPRLLPASQSPRWIPSSLQLKPKSRLTEAVRLLQAAARLLQAAARPVPQPVALRWVWRSQIPTALSQVYPRVASLQA
jgi:hypothetical protein